MLMLMLMLMVMAPHKPALRNGSAWLLAAWAPVMMMAA
jgi:hypothetical protein